METRRTVPLFSATSIAFVSAMCGACASETKADAPDDESRERASELVNGASATARELPSVFAWTDGGDLSATWCTAAKIGARTFLTAAHCVLAQDETPSTPYAGQWRRATRPGGVVTFSFARTIRSSTRAFEMEVAAVHLAPTLEACLRDPARPGPHCARGRTPLPDVAVVEVAEAIGTFARAPRATIDSRPATSGMQLTLTGYGLSRERVAGPPKLRMHDSAVATHAELARALVGTFAEVDGMPDLAYLFGTLGSLIDPSFANLGSGDSGGPVFRRGTSQIVGVNSDGYCPRPNRTCQRASQSEFARIDVGASHGVGEWLRGIARD